MNNELNNNELISELIQKLDLSLKNIETLTAEVQALKNQKFKLPSLSIDKFKNLFSLKNKFQEVEPQIVNPKDDSIFEEKNIAINSNNFTKNIKDKFENLKNNMVPIMKKLEPSLLAVKNKWYQMKNITTSIIPNISSYKDVKSMFDVIGNKLKNKFESHVDNINTTRKPKNTLEALSVNSMNMIESVGGDFIESTNNFIDKMNDKAIYSTNFVINGITAFISKISNNVAKISFYGDSLSELKKIKKEFKKEFNALGVQIDDIINPNFVLKDYNESTKDIEKRIKENIISSKNFENIMPTWIESATPLSQVEYFGNIGYKYLNNSIERISKLNDEIIEYAKKDKMLCNIQKFCEENSLSINTFKNCLINNPECFDEFQNGSYLIKNKDVCLNTLNKYMKLEEEVVAGVNVLTSIKSNIINIVSNANVSAEVKQKALENLQNNFIKVSKEDLEKKREEKDVISYSSTKQEPKFTM